MIKFQQIDGSAKIYKAYRNSDINQSVKFKFFTNYRLASNPKLKIFDFSENIIYHEEYQRFIITRLNEFTNEIEIHCASINHIEEKLHQINSDLSSPIEIPSVLKETIEPTECGSKQQKIISINIKDDNYIIVLIDRLIIYSIQSLFVNSNEKIEKKSEIQLKPIIVSLKPYVSLYNKEQVYLFQKCGRYINNKNLLRINYIVIDLKNQQDQQKMEKIAFSSPIVAQSTEAMQVYIDKVEVKNEERKIFHIKIFTEFIKKVFKQVIIFEPGQPIIIKKQVNYQKFPDISLIPIVSKKENRNQNNQ